MTQIEVTITDEFEDLTQTCVGKLNLEDGLITDIIRNKNDHTKPWKAKDYEFTSGLLKVGNKELEFAINVNKNEEYHVSSNELNEIKEKLSTLMVSNTRKKKM
jgi:hypothetical protein